MPINAVVAECAPAGRFPVQYVVTIPPAVPLTGRPAIRLTASRIY